jgi:hypothetical protein
MGEGSGKDKTFWTPSTGRAAEIIEKLGFENDNGFSDICFRNPTTGEERILSPQVLQHWRDGSHRHPQQASKVIFVVSKGK